MGSKCTRSLRLLLFFFVHLKSWTINQSLIFFFLKIRNKKQQLKTCSFSGCHLWLIPNVCYGNSPHKCGQSAAPLRQSVGDPFNKKEEKKKLKMSPWFDVERKITCWQSDSCITYHKNHKNDYLFPSLDPSRVTSLNWSGLSHKLFSRLLKLDLFLFFSHSILEHTHGKKHIEFHYLLETLTFLNFKKNLSCISHVITELKAIKLNPNVIRAFPKGLVYTLV